jgi:hypothetical protein
MATKTFKPGEYALGGHVKIEVTPTKVTAKFICMFTGKIEAELTVKPLEHLAERKLSDFLCINSTSYYEGKMMDWIKLKIKF